MHKRAFTLIEIMIVILIIGILLAVAVPQWIKARTSSQLRVCQSNMKAMSTAKEHFAMENRLPNGAPVLESDIWPNYIKGPVFPECPQGGVYILGNVGDAVTCTIHGTIP